MQYVSMYVSSAIYVVLGLIPDFAIVCHYHNPLYQQSNIAKESWHLVYTLHW